MADLEAHGPDTADCTQGAMAPQQAPPPGPEAPLIFIPPLSSPSLTPVLTQQEWAAPPGRALDTGLGRCGGASLKGHIRGHFLPFLFIHGLVPSWATEEFSVPCLSSRAWGQREKDDSADVWADGWGPAKPPNHGTLAGLGRGVIWLLPRCRAERKGPCFRRPSCWAGWPGGVIKAWPRPLSHGRPGVTAPSPSAPCPGKGESAAGRGAQE